MTGILCHYSTNMDLKPLRRRKNLKRKCGSRVRISCARVCAFSALLTGFLWRLFKQAEHLIVPVARSPVALNLSHHLSKISLGGCADGLYDGEEFCNLRRCLRSETQFAVISLDGATCPNSIEGFKLKLPTSDHVDLSFILAVQNLPIMTAQVLLELFVTSKEVNTSEFVIVDNGSSVDMKMLYDQVEFLKAHFGAKFKILRHTEALGFSKANNLAARVSSGKYLAFINSDTFVSPGWLKSLMSSIHGDTVAAGPMFLDTNMEVAEAGGVVFSDASAANVGRGTRLEDNLRFARPVDYISAACVVVRKEHFDLVGGFDESYGAGYYEDTDFFKHLNKFGFKVMYQPESIVLHDEGHTYGSDSEVKKRLMGENKEKFRAKWAPQLADHCDPGTEAYIAATRNLFPKVLWLDDIIPEPDRDSGSVRTLTILKLLLAMRCHVSIVSVQR